MNGRLFALLTAVLALAAGQPALSAERTVSAPPAARQAAETAGLKPGDKLLALDGTEILDVTHLQSIIARLPIPVHITLGNHDDRAAFLSVFGPAFIGETGKVDKVIDIKGYRIILLDSAEPGRVDGVLTQAQIAWLHARLAEAMDRPVIVVLHHNANALHIESDNIRILEPDAFITALKTHPDIRQVIAGHVHLTSTATWRGLPFTTLSGNHYSCSVDQPHVPMRRLTGPGQMAFIIADADSTTVLFDDYIDGNQEIVWED